jgi:CRISPR-associated protein Cmr2
MYADRIYFKENERGNASKLKIIIDDIIAKLVDDITLNTLFKGKIIVEKFLKSYLNLHIVEALLDDNKLASHNTSVLLKLNQYLDNKELKTNYSFEFDDNPLVTYLELYSGIQTLLVKDAFDDPDKRRFRSIPEIASSSLDRINKNEYKKLVELSFKEINGKQRQEYELLDEFKKSIAFKEFFRPYHKYFGVLYADGDNISDLLTKVANDKNDLLSFSEKLMEFAILAEQSIVDYGGNGVYLGGEDVLAFIPLACKHKTSNELQTIFSLIKELDTHFSNTLGKYAEEKNVTIPTLSYGLMISYVKHPLKESMQIAHDLLQSSKNIPNKNAIGLRFQKHSGQIIECFIEKSEAKKRSWSMIQEFTTRYTKSAINEKENDILSGIMHRFKDELFYTAFKEAAAAERLVPFFKNFFDEKIHQDEKNIFLKHVRELSEIILSDYGGEKLISRDILFTVLRLVHFINSKKE